MIALFIGTVGALGVFYVVTAAAGWRGIQLSSHAHGTGEQRPPRRRFHAWMVQAGLADVTPTEFVVVTVAAAVVAGLVAYVALGAAVPALGIGLFAATAPGAAYRRRRAALRSKARKAWPRLIEELRVQTSSVGRSVPVALLAVGRRVEPGPMRAAFEAAEIEWLLTTDFRRTVQVLKDRLADPAADAVCETLLVAHDLGGSDLDGRLRALIEDRTLDIQDREDAVSRQSGVRFARWFTLVVPIGMAAVGMTIGDGRTAYRTGGGQLSLVFALVCTVACWVWAGRIMSLPEQERVLDQ